MIDKIDEINKNKNKTNEYQKLYCGLEERKQNILYTHINLNKNKIQS